MKKSQAQNKQALRTQLLNKLNDGHFHLGEDLASELALSRSAISEQIKALNKLGLDICSIKGRGYKLTNHIELLSHSQIQAALPASSQGNAFLIQIENLVSSTNDIVKAKSHSVPYVDSGYCCLAEAQSAGRGRRGRNWVSPYASSLYLSMLWRFTGGHQAMTGLSLMVGVIINETLQSLEVLNCQLKWPNDVYHEQKKLAGVLIEVEGQVGATTSAIIGIGININLPANVQGINQAFTDLSSITKKPISKNQLAAALIHKLWQNLPIFEAHGMAPFMARWKDCDLYYKKHITIVAGDKIITGTGNGIDNTGALLLDINGSIKAFHGGEISVRQA
ncbi:BirA family transcriptional regulator, biotin operon repressor [Glaciecola punicea ACAM 611]|jgi:BirA family biotin operon repressor/biotin-[acetyl-CoA-carboxylase] ligase|uniref:Bifunctional ligase/repressor BirA n=1 Tax=Glaciecola punicea ACAM 611 TaxID=1121923 RepID=H5TFF8_9ALTE|nr:bifunctional biotin--[acetyl-CoA-carboxylase] ligase/biotin operon repressor BirA [Glaciecola punicea]OFA30092.1 biotin--[acetyl-CoA-carboxylase] ligase [Glaciecola punicea]GAB57035.1 BirA family transcriptional regulator, biotin operon repressor [Glaciecola punicea ACAM 611]